MGYPVIAKLLGMLSQLFQQGGVNPGALDLREREMKPRFQYLDPRGLEEINHELQAGPLFHYFRVIVSTLFR